MRPSSSPFEISEPFVRAMLEVEGALALESAIPQDHAARIASVCSSLEVPVETLRRESVLSGTPVIPLVAAIRSAVGEPAAASVHRGATSQDIVDTATMLVCSRRLSGVIADLEAAAFSVVSLAIEHRSTAMVGRTLLQRAAPVTFGLVAAGWLVALDTVISDLSAVRSHRLAAQLGGPVGTGSPALASRVAARLGLQAPVVPWHTDRTRVASLATALGTAAGAMAKVARDVVLLAQNEAGELAEASAPGRGASSSLPHKANPVAAVSALGFAQRAPGLVATVLSAMEQELQRAAGAWQAEHGALFALLDAVDSAAARLRDCLGGLRVDVERMRRNLADFGASTDSVGAAGELVDRAVDAHWRRRAIRPSFVRSGSRSGRTVVLAGSLGTDLHIWDPIRPALESRLDVVAFDLRGHGASGRSPVPDPPYDIADLGHDVLALLDDLGVERADFAGVSIGGLVGLWLAVHAPERLGRLVLCGTSARFGPPELFVQRASDVRAKGLAPLASEIMARWFDPSYEGAGRARLHAMLTATSPEGYAACCELLARTDLRDALGSITAPTLVVAGAGDLATPPSEHGIPVAEGIPGARLEVLDGVGHLAPVETPDAVAALILDHLMGEGR